MRVPGRPTHPQILAFATAEVEPAKTLPLAADSAHVAPSEIAKKPLGAEWQSALLSSQRALASLRSLTKTPDLPSARAWFVANASNDPLLEALDALAKRHGTSFGVYGGSARDMLLGAGRAPGSDIDFIYDSSEPGFAAFQQEANAMLVHMAPEVKADWAADLSKQRPWGATRGVTVDKVGVLSDGRIFDFSGTGASDLAAGVVRFFPDNFALDRVSHVMRAVKLINRYPELHFDDATRTAITEAVKTIRTSGLARDMRAYFAGLRSDAAVIDGKQISAAHAAYKSARREPLAGDVIEVIGAAHKIGKNGLDAARVQGVLRELGVLQLLADMGLREQLAPLFPAPDAEWTTLASTLEHDAARANLELACDSLRATAKEAGREDIVAALAGLTLPDAGGFDFLRAALPGAESLIDTAKEQLVHTRFGRVFEDRFALSELQTISVREGVEPIRSVHQGFWPDVASFDPDAPHSMHEVGKYVDGRLWSAVSRDAIEHQRRIELHEGTVEDAFASLALRGFTEVARIEVPKGERFNQLYAAKNPATGEVRYMMCEIYGFDRLFHQQMLWRCAGTAGARVKQSQIEVHRQPLRSDVEIYRRYSRALLASPQVPDNVLVGFVNGMRKELAARHKAAATLAAWQAEGVSAELREQHPVLGKTPAEVFKSQELVSAMQKVAPLLSFKDTARVVEDDFLDQLLFSYKDGRGETKHLLVTRMPYGELAHSLGKAFVDRGVQQVLVMGTAGALQNARLGDAVLPSSFRLPDGRMFGLDKNNLLELVGKRDDLPLPKGVHLHGKTATVRTPLEESESFVDEYKVEGYDLLEMEVGHFASALKGTAVALSAVNIVSDIPGSAHTLESHLSDTSVKEKFKALADHVIALFDIQALLPKAAVSATGFEKATAVAELLAGAQSGSPEHTLYRYNLARYVNNGAPVHMLADPSVTPEDIVAALGSRWREKIDRDRAIPYTDAEVLRELDAKEAELRAAAIYLRTAGTPPAGASLHLMGGITKGRFGCGSDLDLLVDADPVFAQWALRSEVGALNPNAKEIRLGELGYAKARSEQYASFERLGTIDEIADGNVSLRELLARTMAKMGVVLDTKTGHIETRHARVSREVPEVDEYLFEHEKAFKGAVDTSVLLKYIGAPIDAQELRAYKLKQLEAMGNTIADRLFGAELNAERMLTYLGSAAAASYWQRSGVADVGAFLRKKDPSALAEVLTKLNPEELADLAGLRDPLERVAFLLAGLSRMKVARQRDPSAMFASERAQSALFRRT